MYAQKTVKGFVNGLAKSVAAMALVALAALAHAQSASYVLSVSSDGSGRVSSTPPGIACSVIQPSCSASFPAGTVVTLNVEPAASLASWSGACSGSANCQVTMSSAQSVTANFATNCPIAVQSGWWWDPAQGGRGYFVDNQGGSIYFAALVYDAAGNETWSVASGFLAAGAATAQGPTCTFSSVLQSVSGGQTFTGAYQPPTQVTSLGNIIITFTDATDASAVFPSETIPLQRYVFSGSAPPAPDAHNGVWWNPAEGGRGFVIDIQNNALYMGAYMYDASGNPVWYVTGPGALGAASCCGGLSTPTPGPYSGQWVEYTGGQAPGGPYRSPTVLNSNVGSVTLQFSNNPRSATLTLPNGTQIPIVRYQSAQ